MEIDEDTNNALRKVHYELSESIMRQLKEAGLDEQSPSNLEEPVSGGILATITRLKHYLAASSISLTPSLEFGVCATRLTPLDRRSFPNGNGKTTEHFQVQWEVQCRHPQEHSQSSVRTCVLSFALHRRDMDKTAGWNLAAGELQMAVDSVRIQQDALQSARDPRFQVPDQSRDRVLLDLMTGVNISAALRVASVDFPESDMEHIQNWESELSTSVLDALKYSEEEHKETSELKIDNKCIEAGCDLLKRQLIGYISDSDLLHAEWTIEPSIDDEAPVIILREPNPRSETKPSLLEVLIESTYDLFHRFSGPGDDDAQDDDSYNHGGETRRTTATIFVVLTPSLTWEIEPKKTQIVIDKRPISEKRNAGHYV